MDFAAARAGLLESLGREVTDKRVLGAIARIPRELFVPSHDRHLAYEDMPIPIGLGQTISQPLIVALMTQALELTGREKALEVGTGSGYQAAILAELACRVVTVERLPTLAESARETLTSLGYDNVELYPAGETLGYPPGAPYDAIIVTAATPEVPPVLLAQLATDGRMVIPVGSRRTQELLRITKRPMGNVVKELGGCRFVPLIGKGAWED